MLTKNLLKYTVRKQKVYPKLIDPVDIAVQKLSKDLLEVYENCAGITVSALQDKVSKLKGNVSPLFDGFNKLLLDRTESSLGEDSETIQAKRWELVYESQNLRQERPFENLQEFYEELETRVGCEVTLLQRDFYADLPESQVITKFKPLKQEALAHRYNCGQIQGLLMFAHSMQVTLQGASLALKRSLFRQIKFHRLLVHVTKDTPSVFSFELSGPLSVFSSRQTYSMRLANFFPHVLNAEVWDLKASLTLKGKKADLILDSSSKIKSHYSVQEPYIPKELSLFVEKFNQKQDLWQADYTAEFVNLGKKKYCFPDLTLTHKKGKKLYLELFHKWHLSQLVDRIGSLKAKEAESLIIGCCDSLKAKKELKDILVQSEKNQKNLFFFKEFPSSAKVLKHLDHYG